MGGYISYRRPANLVAVINVIGFALLYFYKKPFDKFILLAGIAVITLIYLAYYIIIKKRLGDGYIFLIAGMLASMGVIMLYRLDRKLGFQQIVWFGTGIVLFFSGYYLYIKVKSWDRFIYYYPAGSLVLFLITLAFGKNIRGATNWIVINGHSFQPSEFIKLLFIFFLASFYKKYGKTGLGNTAFQLGKVGIKNKYVLMAVAYAHLGFLVLQQEWGTALLIFLIYFMMLYVFSYDLKLLLINSAMAMGGGLLGALFVNHVKVRIETWLNPWADIAGKGYQITQSLFAIASGGFFGSGIGLGRPDFIPEVSTDFIFSAVCEEMGILGGVAVILLYFILAYRGFKVSLSAHDYFHKALALGITLMFGFQTFIIIGGVIKLIPLTGITLPFISYGGSSLTVSFISLGILQAVSSEPYVEEEVIDK